MRRLLILAAVVAFAGGGPAQGNGVSFSVEPNSVTIGEIFKVTVQFTLPADHDAVIPGEDADFSEAEVRGFRREQAAGDDGSVLHTATWELVLWETGETTLTAPSIASRGPDGDMTELDRPDVTVTVRSVLPEGAETIKDIRGPREMPLKWHHYVIAALPVLGLLGLIAALVWWLRSRGADETEEEPEAPPLPPAEEALLALRELEGEDLVGEGMIKEHYVRLSRLLRNYIERRWNLPALEETTGMLAYTMTGSGRVAEDTVAEITALLRRADLAKFAKHRPDSETARNDVDEVRSIVRSTRPRGEVTEGAAPDEAAPSPAS